MPRLIASDHQNTSDYIPILFGEYAQHLKNLFKKVETRSIHKGRVVDDDYDDMVYLNIMFGITDFDCLFKINEQIVPQFILEFYSQFRLSYNKEGHMLVEFIIQNKFFSYTLKELGQILRIPIEVQCLFTNQWSLDKLTLGVPSEGCYQTDPPYPDQIKSYIQLEREEPLTRVYQGRTVYVEENQIITREVQPNMKTWVEIIRENAFCLSGNWDHHLAYLGHMLYCIACSMRHNLVFFIAKRMEFVRRQPRMILPYGMLLTRLYNYVMSNFLEFFGEQYVLYNCVMFPLAQQHERKIQKDCGTKMGRHSTSASSYSAFDYPSSSHHVDDVND
ncbi:hypothetical protein Tco_0705632 [Tanacetum coccineum]|uniref:Uncharacterized protein n=1 Tax=Tanacetum coccineum TaxID=301880 RepID=A0ABQ4Y596_9ASTR